MKKLIAKTHSNSGSLTEWYYAPALDLYAKDIDKLTQDILNHPDVVNGEEIEVFKKVGTLTVSRQGTFKSLV